MFGLKYVSLTFSDKFLKAVSAKPIQGGLKIFSVVKKAIPEGTVFNGKITNPELFAESLKAFYLETYDQLKTKDLVVGLPEQETFLAKVAFAEKPKNLEKAIREQIAPALPFELEKTIIIWQEVAPLNYQVAATREASLQTLSIAIKGSSFRPRTFVPIPLVFPRLVDSREDSYLFISAEEDLIFSLVSGGAILFSSTFKLKREIVNSQKEILKIANEIIKAEYKKFSNERLTKVYLSGKGSEFLKSFFSSSGYSCQIIFSPAPSGKLSVDPGEFARSLLLCFYDSSVLSFPGQEPDKIKISAPKPSKSFSLLKTFLSIVLILLFAAAIFFFWPILRDRFTTLIRGLQPTESTKQTTQERLTTPSSNKNKATEPAVPKEIIDKQAVTIRILNGSGKSGAANDAKNFLVAREYNVVETGNAGNFNYEQTDLRVKQSKQGITDLLTKDLQERYAINVGPLLPEGETYDVLIIIGKN